MDKDTLKKLIKEAKKNKKAHEKVFGETDNRYDLEQIYRWTDTVSWLRGKLEGL